MEQMEAGKVLTVVEVQDTPSQASTFSVSRQGAGTHLEWQAVEPQKVTKTSELQNDSGFIGADEVNTKLADKADKTQLPTKTSELVNDSDFANKDFVNSSIATNTANFKGTFNNESEFPNEATNNDYLFLNTVDENGNTIYKRYKYIASTSTWTYEYTLNNSSFTSQQWATINNGPYARVGDIPTKTSQLQNDSGFLDASDELSFNNRIDTALDMAQDARLKCQDANDRITNLYSTLNFYATKDELGNKADKTQLPTKTSQLENDSGFVVESEVQGLRTEITQATEIANTAQSNVDALQTNVQQNTTALGQKADRTELPTKTSELQNDSGYTTQSYVDNAIGNVLTQEEF